MSKRQWLMVLGVLVSVMPFSGFPYDWVKNIEIVLGILVIIISYGYRTKPSRLSESDKALPFAEQKNFGKAVGKEISAKPEEASIMSNSNDK